MSLLRNLAACVGRDKRSVPGVLAAALAALVLAMGLGGVGSARADTVASLLGNYTINQFAGIRVDKHQVKLHFVVVYGQLPALTALHKADTNADGVTTQAERDAYAKRLAPGFARKLDLTVGSKRVPLRLVSWTSSLPSESTGFSLRLDARYVGKLPAGLPAGAIHHLKFDNTNFTGRVGWHEIVVKPGSGMSIFDTNAFSSSLTKGLSINPEKLPPGGPLNERAVHLAFVHGAAPPGVVMLAPRKVASEKVAAGSGSGDRSGIRATGVASTFLNSATKSLVDRISGPHLSVGVALLALLIAMALGALHAFSPGHGKTVVGAYLIGSRGTPRHAFFLGLTVTITHTIGVFALGLATLFAAQFIMPEKLFPILSLVSGVFVLVIGLALFIRRLRSARGHGHDHTPAHGSALTVAWAGAPAAAHGPVHEHEHVHEHHHDHPHEHAHEHGHEHGHAHGAALAVAWSGAPASAHEHAHDHAHAHAHEHVHDHVHEHTQGALTHTHGGTTHTHLPPGADGERVTWKSLLGLGISGGLIPCPSAMILLLAAIALHKTGYGLVLVLAFSVGLAITISCVGLAFLYARRLFGHSRRVPARLLRVLPVVSAGFITCVGAVLCYGALAGVSIAVP